MSKKDSTLFIQSIRTKNKKVKLFWCDLKSDSSSNIENISKSKSSWSKHKSDLSYNIENSFNNKPSCSNFMSDSSYNIENSFKNNKSNNTDSGLINIKKDITTE